MGIVQFLVLESQEVLVLSALGDFLLQVQQLFVGFPVLAEKTLVGGALLVILCDDVNNVQLEVLLLQEQVLVLGVDVHQLLSEFSHPGERYGGVVDEGTALASRRQFPADDCVGGVIVDVVVSEELLHIVPRQVEVCLYDATVLASLDCLGVGPVAEQETNGAEDDTLSSSRLSRDNGEAGVQLDIQFVDEREVLDVKLFEHSPFFCV